MSEICSHPVPAVVRAGTPGGVEERLVTDRTVEGGGEGGVGEREREGKGRGEGGVGLGEREGRGRGGVGGRGGGGI